MSDVAQIRKFVAGVTPAASSLEVDFSLEKAAQQMSGILATNGLSARLRLGGRSCVVGRLPKTRDQIVEFVFSSQSTFDLLMANVRLYSFAKAYFDEELDILGPFEEAIEVLYAINIACDSNRNVLEHLRSFVFRAAKATIPFFAKRFESGSHYSMSVDAYRMFLDKNMQYTCGKFIVADDDLDNAQINKFFLIANLAKPYFGGMAGIKHLDIGCGWGGLIAYFTKYFSTNSSGNTNSKIQKKYAEEHYGASVLLGDFSELKHLREQYDLVTIIGMAEHLTPRRRSQLFQVVERSLKKEGLLYFQCIARPNVWIGGDAYRIAYDDVFPGHYLESRSEMEARFRRAGLEILYAADDADDYAKTMALWVKNLQLNKQEVTTLIGARNFRILLGYLAYGSKLFASGRGSLMRYMLRRRPEALGNRK